MKRTFVLLLALLPLAAMAQTGTISGTISDENTGEPLIGANAIILGTDRGAATNIDGKFVIDSLPPGNYTLRITYIGYTSDTIDVVLLQGADVTLDVKLREQPIPEGSICPSPAASTDRNPSRHIELGEYDPIMNIYGIGPW